jgi:hypothetical protein
VGGAGTRGGIFLGSAGSVAPAAPDGSQVVYARGKMRADEGFGKLRNLASDFGKLLEIDFVLFCQILKDDKSFTKVLEMLNAKWKVSDYLTFSV